MAIASPSTPSDLPQHFAMSPREALVAHTAYTHRMVRLRLDLMLALDPRTRAAIEVEIDTLEQLRTAAKIVAGIR